MTIAIVSANTGNGHRAVMNALIEEFESREFRDLIPCPEFYEECLISNRILSDFYNYLISTSIPLGAKYTELASLTRPDVSDEIYNASYEKLCELVETEGLKAIISTAPLINHGLVRILKEKELSEKIPLYIVVTDPFDPIAPGFDIVGASRYFCFSKSVKKILVDSGIADDLVQVADYPVANKFFRTFDEQERAALYNDYDLSPENKTLLINAGANGNMSLLKCLEAIKALGNDLQIIFVCGKNKALKVMADRFKLINDVKNLVVLGFTKDMHLLLEMADICISKAGANTYFECLAKDTFFIVYGIDGFLYQEKGVVDVADEGRGVSVLNCYDELRELVEGVDFNHACADSNNRSYQEGGARAIADEVISNL